MSIIKTDDLINKILSLFWLEKILNIKRFGIYDIKTEKIEEIKTILNENIERLYWFYKTNEGKKETIKSVKNKIQEINNLNLLQKFVADCYNTISENAVEITKSKVYKKRVYSYTEYKFKYFINIFL